MPALHETDFAKLEAHLAKSGADTMLEELGDRTKESLHRLMYKAATQGTRLRNDVARAMATQSLGYPSRRGRIMRRGYCGSIIHCEPDGPNHVRSLHATKGWRRRRIAA